MGINRYINSIKGKSSTKKRMSPSGIYTLHFKHTRRQRFLLRRNQEKNSLKSDTPSQSLILQFLNLSKKRSTGEKVSVENDTTKGCLRRHPSLVCQKGLEAILQLLTDYSTVSVCRTYTAVLDLLSVFGSVALDKPVYVRLFWTPACLVLSGTRHFRNF